jgi:hypothetical protein
MNGYVPWVQDVEGNRVSFGGGLEKCPLILG